MAGAKSSPEQNVVMVVVQAEREISKTSLSWALSHLVRPGDFVTLLTVIPQRAKSRRERLWSIPKFAGECATGQGRRSPESRRKEELSLWRLLTTIQLHEKALDSEKVNVRIKVVSASRLSDGSAVAAEGRRIGATWIVLDRQLKHEAKNCMRENQDCSIVLMERNEAKILRLNLRSQPDNKEDVDDYEDHGHLTHPTLARSPEKDHMLHTDLRRTSSISAPPPLCAVCQHRAPQFGKAPKFFHFRELEEATSSFCDKNLLGNHETSSVHRGLLRNGQVIAVKRMIAIDGDEGEFRAQVDVYSRAQHRNVVMLVGFSVEARKRVLVYEYICNGSLADYLPGQQLAPLDWPQRLRIAIGVARGLRYLHEDCRLGFIHGDVRPSNILLTHEFQPLISGFGFSRWKTEDTSSDCRIRLGYLAPEIVGKESLTEKADVYAFGVVLLELLTGRKAIDRERPKGQQFLADWVRPVFHSQATGGASVDGLLDPRVDPDYSPRFSHQVNALFHAAAACLRRDPKTRPTMTKVLRMVEEAENMGLGVNVDHWVNGSRSLSRRQPQESVTTAQPNEMRIRAPNLLL